MEEQKELSEVSIKNISGTAGIKKEYTEIRPADNCKYKLYILNGDRLFSPIVEDDITLDIFRSGAPSTLTFTVFKDDTIDFLEGNTVIFKVNGTGVFYGYVFTKSRSKEHHIKVTAYDQLRYFKNSETYIYKNKKASQIVSMICDDFKLNVGSISDTNYVIPSKIEDNQCLFDIVENALQTTFENIGARFILHDKFGKICLENTNALKLDLIIDSNNAEDFTYASSINDNTYTRVKVFKDNSDTGQRETYVAEYGVGVSAYGVLQKVEQFTDDENPISKAENILNQYKEKTRKLIIKNAFGDIRVIGGSQLLINLNLGDISINAFMMVDEVTHKFEKDRHTMDLILIKYGQFVS